MPEESQGIKGLGIDKYFHGGEITALKNARISLHRHEIHGLLGENGSGKTTLIRCLAGLVQPDAGQLQIDGRRCAFSRRTAAEAGIAMVSQHPRLVPSLTLMEYFQLNVRAGGAVIRQRIMEIGGRLKIELPLEARGDRIPANLATAGVLAGVLLTNPRYLILDEPTTSFTPLETENLFSFLQELAAEGLGVLLVSHKIKEVHHRVDRLTLLRKGETVIEEVPEKLSLEEVSRMLMGSGDTAPEIEPAVPGPVCLEARDLSRTSRESAVKELSFTLHRGEILAVSGIRENGLDCLEKILSARRPPDSGGLYLEKGEEYPESPEGLRSRNIVLVPSDRLESGAALQLTVGENAAVLVRHTLSRRGILTAAAQERYAEQLLAEYDIETSPEVSASTLSGGMLQRLILGRELETASGLVILCEPAWGLDIRSRQEVYRRILALRDQGAGILLLASDIDEVLEIADRLLVLYDGRITARFERREFDHGRIGNAMLGISETGAAI